jgi:hypothetical protein
LSAAAFARQQGIGYTTFCSWRHRQARCTTSPDFVEVELAAPAKPVELWLEGKPVGADLNSQHSDQITPVMAPARN